MSVARASERRWKRGKPLSPIDGVPVFFKEGRIDGADTSRQGIAPDHGIGQDRKEGHDEGADRLS